MFMLIAVAVLVGVVLAVSGTFSQKGVPYRAYFKYASGLAPAVPVRYGGLLAGRVEGLRVDPADSTRIEIEFKVEPEIPVKTDSVAKITSLGALGESYLELTTGTKGADLAPPGSVITSQETVALSDLGGLIGALVPSANQVLHTMNDRLVELKVTIDHFNDLLGDQNRKNLSASLRTLSFMLAENRPKIAATLDNLQGASDKLQPVVANVKTASDRITPLLNDFKATLKQANDALSHADTILVENRPEIKATIADVRKTLNGSSALVDQLRGVADRNADNLDDTFGNLRELTNNVKELTDTLNRNPSVLVRGDIGRDRQPGGNK
jgi:phospholipid/cholesterol/gamma-HCH transport system substrate-binding protein